MTDFALSELQAVLRLACRGIGHPAALGEDLAEAVAFAPAEFGDWDQLRRVFAAPIQSGLSPDGATGEVRCLTDGAAVAEMALVSDTPIEISRVDAPAILALYLRRASVLFETDLIERVRLADLAGDNPVIAAPLSDSQVSRVVLPDGLYGHLSALASRTFVVATEATRLSGAGAGLNDND